MVNKLLQYIIVLILIRQYNLSVIKKYFVFIVM